MKFTRVFIVLMVMVALLMPTEGAPGKIPVKAIQKAGRAVVST